MVVADAARLVAWRIGQLIRLCQGYALAKANGVRDGGRLHGGHSRVYAVSGEIVDHRINHEVDPSEEVDMAAFAAWLRAHGIIETSHRGLRDLHWEYAQIMGQRMLTERSMAFALGRVGIAPYRPWVNGDRVTRYKIRSLEPPAVAGHVKSKRPVRSLGDVSTPSVRPLRRAA